MKYYKFVIIFKDLLRYLKYSNIYNKMFLLLPKNCQELIYENLDIIDRINLNNALPKDNKINKTINTNKESNKNILIISKLIKKNKINKNKKSLKIVNFIKNNISDPIVKNIAKLLDINIDNNNNNNLNNDNIIDIEKLKNHIINDIFDENFIQSILNNMSLDVYKRKHYSYDIEYLLCLYLKPMNFYNYFNIFKNCIIDNKIFTFNCLNYGNYELFTYIYNNLIDILNIDRNELENSIITLMGHQKNHRQFIWNNIELSDENKTIILNRMIEECDFDGIRELFIKFSDF